MKPLKSILGLSALFLGLFQAQFCVAQTLQQSSNNRYLQWSNGTPFFIVSDTAWLLTYKYSDQEVKDYLDSRAAQGFNTIQLTCCFPENNYMDVNKIFTGGDLGKPIATYWAHVDWVVNQITSRGLVAILNPFWKKTSDDWLHANGPAKCRAYGKWFGNRFRSNPRVIYFIGGDSAPEPIRAEMDAMGQGVQDAYAGAAIVAYHGAPDKSSRDAFPTATWLTLDWIYSYAPPFGKIAPYQETWNSWTKYSDLPMQFGEGFYDFGEATARSRFGDRYMVRKQAWWSTVGGAIGGYAYGAEAIWFHNKNNTTGAETWQEAVQYESGKDIIRLKGLINTLAWPKLEPDINHAFLTGGFGTFGSIDFALAAVANDKSFALVYTPVAHTLALKMPTSGKTYALRWWDPSNAQYHAGSTAATSGQQISIASPGNNSSGKPDWVLVVTANNGGPTSTYQAEDTTLAANAALETTNAGWTGTGYVNTANVVGAYVEWKITLPAAGTYNLDFRYANGTLVNRPADLAINGAIVQKAVSFSGDGVWTNWRDITLRFPLSAGTNTLRLTATSAAGCANLDKLTLDQNPGGL